MTELPPSSPVEQSTQVFTASGTSATLTPATDPERDAISEHQRRFQHMSRPLRLRFRQKLTRLLKRWSVVDRPAPPAQATAPNVTATPASGPQQQRAPVKTSMHGGGTRD
eukprot:CAMPEP_0181326452 /NCGR_PEP_ID=MMETSP1101-20121128/21504_1 /TAXON_ID=46948 /ORGANISM="Rhodomonas abbreviata, Strain Caron Lab Isolate" /LENGTH=109 /DNA_ID=CAMNT_0023434903 /DNA_START=25 /DNA_END=355 /DNA_ORIENTATION=+